MGNNKSINIGQTSYLSPNRKIRMYNNIKVIISLGAANNCSGMSSAFKMVTLHFLSSVFGMFQISQQLEACFEAKNKVSIERGPDPSLHFAIGASFFLYGSNGWLWH